MQINLFINKDSRSFSLSKWINYVIGLNIYKNILPKSIKIHINDIFSTSFYDKVFKIFDKSITEFNEINW